MPNDASHPDTTDLLARLRLVAAWRKPGGPTPSEPMPSNYRTACDAAAEIERLRTIPTAQEIRLAAGEMTAQEMRTVLAVLRWCAEPAT